MLCIDQKSVCEQLTIGTQSPTETTVNSQKLHNALSDINTEFEELEYNLGDCDPQGTYVQDLYNLLGFQHDDGEVDSDQKLSVISEDEEGEEEEKEVEQDEEEKGEEVINSEDKEVSLDQFHQ